MSSTSGRVESGTANGSRFYFQWQLTGQDIGGNYSNINWQWGLNISPGGYYWATNAVKSVSGYINGGQAFGGNTWSNISGTGDHQLLAGSWSIGHDGNGYKDFGISSTGNLYQSGNLGNSGTWNLPTIPRHSILTGISTDAGGIPFTDEGPAWVEFANPAGTGTQGFIDVIGYGRVVTSGNVGSRYNFDYSGGLPAAIQAASPNSNTYQINIGIIDQISGGDNYDYRVRDGTIKNDTGQANPLFPDFTYKDTTAFVTAVTGNDQYIVQGVSTLEAKVTVANKATPRKFATMDHYTFNIGSYSQNAAWSTSSDVAQTIGYVSDVSGPQPLTVTAVDSRGNTKAITKTIQVVPYQPPIQYNTVTRANGFDDALILNLVNASISPVTIGGVMKNTIRPLSGQPTGLQYRFIADGGDITAVSWTDIPYTLNTDGTYTANTPNIIIAAAGSASSQHNYKVQIRVTDQFYTATNTITVPSGIPIFRIGQNGNLYWQEQEFHNEFNPQKNFLVPGITANAVTGTFGYIGASGYAFGAGLFSNFSAPALGDQFYIPVFLNAGTYSATTSFFSATTNGIATLSISGGSGFGSGTGTFQTNQDTYNAAGNSELLYTLNGITITQPGYYNFWYTCTTKNAATGTTYRIGVFGILFKKTA